MLEESVVKEGLRLIPEEYLCLEIKILRKSRKYFKQRILKHLDKHIAKNKKGTFISTSLYIKISSSWIMDKKKKLKL